MLSISSASSHFPPCADLVPHRGPALLLNRVLSHHTQQTVCLALLTESHPYLQGGLLNAAILLELMAQTTAVHARLLEHESEAPPRLGYIVGAPQLEFLRDHFQPGEELQVTVEPLFTQGQLAQFACRVECKGELAAQGHLQIYVEPNSAPLGSSLSSVEK